MRLEPFAPGRTGIREQDIDVLRVLRYLSQERLNALHRSAVSGGGDGACAGLKARELVKLCYGLVAGFRLPRRDEDFGASGLEKPVERQSRLARCLARRP